MLQQDLSFHSPHFRMETIVDRAVDGECELLAIHS